MPNLPIFNLFWNTSRAYHALGYAAIPVFGDFSPSRAKAAAIPWKAYQARKPTEQELYAWFDNTYFTAIAIITGTVSQLAVLDFDDLDHFNRFEASFPELTQTRIVKTRRGYHLYYHVPKNLKTRSRMGQGVDWLYNGRYVIAPPSTIDGFTYTIHRGGMPLALNQQQLHQIMGFMQFKPEVPSPQTAPEPQSTLSIHELVGMYRYRSKQGSSRNQVLFRTALDARDHGIPVDETIAALCDPHANNQLAGKWEHAQRREREAIATIRSAYSRPPQLNRKKYTEPDQLPNTIREKLASMNLVSVVRVVEGLRLKGVKPGQVFTEGQARQLLVGIVGKHSIRRCLTAITGEDYLIEREKSPSRTPPMPKGIASKNLKDTNSKCLELSATVSEFVYDNGRTLSYTMPSNAGLAVVLDVKLTQICDALCEDDLKSAKKTRLAMHKGLIQRRPNIYSRQWLAGRIGVSVRSLQRYNRDAELHIVPMYNDVRIHWHNLGEIPPENEFYGVHLEDGKGKRYPAKVPIARKLLAQGHRLRIRWRTHSFYSVDARIVPYVQCNTWQSVPADTSMPPLSMPVPEPVKRDLPPVREYVPAKVIDIRCVPEKVEPQRSTPSYRRRFKDEYLEARAMQIYKDINALVGRSGISRIGARKMVGQYGIYPVERAVKRLLKREGISNPVGWLVTVLRSEAKFG